MAIVAEELLGLGPRQGHLLKNPPIGESIYVSRWDQNAGLRRDAIGSQVIDTLEAQEIKETGNEED